LISGRCEADVGQGPASVAVLFLVFGAVLQPNADIAFRFAENLFGVILAPSGFAGSSLPLDAAKLPIQEIGGLNSSGICQTALKEQIPPEERP